MTEKTTVPKGAKAPQDHKSKDESAPERFSFEHDGETYTLKPTYDVLTPGFLRKNRRLDETDAFFTMLEELVEDEETLDVVDNMHRDDFKDLVKRFYKYLEVSGSGE